MRPFTLSRSEIEKLKYRHKKLKGKQGADRIKTILLLSEGYSQTKVAEILLLDEGTIRNYKKKYQEEGIIGLLENDHQGSQSKLSQEEKSELDQHLQETIALSTNEVIEHVKNEFDVHYSQSGMRNLLHEMDFVYKKPKVIPGKADAQKQKDFLADYRMIREHLSEIPFYFLDGVHPQHNTKAAYGWIKKKEEKKIRSNTGRKRININGGLQIQTLEVAIELCDSVNAQSTIELLNKIEERHPEEKEIFALCDNATYYRSRKVKDYLATSKITFLHLPPYSPNLNLIERLWKVLYKDTLYNKYYEKFEDFKKACLGFFEDLSEKKDKLCSVLKENFQIIGAT